MIKKLIKGIKNPKKILIHFIILISKFIKSDKLYLKILYKLSVGKTLDLNNPITFTEKMQWLKLYNKSDKCTQLVDKYSVRDFVKEKIGEEYLIPLLGVYNKFDDINFNDLPEQFVLKTNHDSGGVIICKDKNKLNMNQANKLLTKKLKRNYFFNGREYPYKNVIPRIIAEKFMINNDGKDISDYKFFCFNGQPKILFFASDRFNKKHEPAKFDYYDMNLKKLPIKSRGHKNSIFTLAYFSEFETMKNLATQLSEGFPFVRVDFYLINQRVYFGEMTFHHDGGFVTFEPDKWDNILGDMIQLPEDVKL